MKYPLAARKPIAVTFGSVSYTDPYQWLEEDAPAALDWQNQQNAVAKEWLSSRSSRAKSLEIQSRIPRLTTDWPTYAGGRLFLRHTPTDQEFQVIQVADSEQGPWKTLVDLNEMATGEPLAFDSFAPSPDGKKLLFGWGAGGRELQNLRVIDVDSGEILHDGVRQIRPLFPTWLPDSSGFYYSAYLPDNRLQVRVFRQILGAAHVTNPEEIEPSHPFMWVQRAADNKHMII
jgi:prolyl oligopeptidase